MYPINAKIAGINRYLSKKPVTRKIEKNAKHKNAIKMFLDLIIFIFPP